MGKGKTELVYERVLKEIISMCDSNRDAQFKSHWEMGRYIAEIEETTEEHRSLLIRQLSDDLTKRYGKGFSRSNLLSMRKFYYTYETVQPAGQIEWTKYLLLLSIKDERVRERFLKKAIEENLTRNQLKKCIDVYRLQKDREDIQSGKYEIEYGSLYCYRKVETEIPNEGNKITIDCGFNILRTIEIEKGKLLDDAELFRAEKRDGKYIVSEVIKPSKEREKKFHTYKATVEKVIDGDTLWVNVDTGFDTVIKEKIRLRGIDTPEMDFDEGKKAREFVKRQLGRCKFVVIKTYKTDMYDRYIGDVFYLQDEDDLEKVCREGKLLNRELLLKGYARAI